MNSPNNEGTPESGGDPIDRVLERLERVRPSGGGWSARCPAHDDRKPSLSVTVADDLGVAAHTSTLPVREAPSSVGLQPLIGSEGES